MLMITIKQLHNELVRWRLPHMTTLIVFVLIAVNAWQFYKDNFAALEAGGAVAFGMFCALVFGVITACLNYMGKRYEKDEHD